jgi:hypothetical protein
MPGSIPDLSMEFSALLDELEQDPATISMVDQQMGRNRIHAYKDFANTIHFMNYQPINPPPIDPYSLHNPCYSRIAAQAFSQQLVGRH